MQPQRNCGYQVALSDGRSSSHHEFNAEAEVGGRGSRATPTPRAHRTHEPISALDVADGKTGGRGTCRGKVIPEEEERLVRYYESAEGLEIARVKRDTTDIYSMSLHKIPSKPTPPPPTSFGLSNLNVWRKAVDPIAARVVKR